MSDGILTFLVLASTVGGLYGFALLARDLFRLVFRGLDWLAAHSPLRQKANS